MQCKRAFVSFYVSMMQALLLLVSSLTLTLCDHDFSSYPFKATLNTAENGGLYELYWNFDNDAENISFAVRVETTGWVGFGLSPNGQMPNSDMVIGWVTDDGDIVFHVSVIIVHDDHSSIAYIYRFAGSICRRQSLSHNRCKSRLVFEEWRGREWLHYTGVQSQIHHL